MIEVLDNYLPEEHFVPIYDYFMGNESEWHWMDGVVTVGDGFTQFIDVIYDGFHPNSRGFDKLWHVFKQEKMVALNRIKANLGLKTNELIIYDGDGFHYDVIGSDQQISSITTGILYINTNNGYTLFENGDKVSSVRNRFLKFPANTKHTGTNCTDQDKRVLINFNYV